MHRLPAPRFLAAIDLDGTLFDHDGQVGAENLAALDRLVGRGYGVVLASGRHPQNMAGIAAALPHVRAIVACQGGEVCDRTRGRILAQHFMQAADVALVVAAGLSAGFGVVAYTEHGEHAPRECPDVERYRRIAKTVVECVSPAVFAAERVFKVMWIAEEARLEAFLAAGGAAGCRPAAADSVRSHREVFEYGPRWVTKATGTAVVARELGIAAADVAAFGDADNDVPLFTWAGFSAAMPHARPEVRRRATVTAPAGPAESAFARAVDLLLATPSPAPATPARP